MSNTFLITGASGYVGVNICNYLSRKGYNVKALLKNINPPGLSPEVEQIKGNVLEPSSMDDLFKGCDGEDVIFIHAAAIISVSKNDFECYETNVEGTKNVINLCKKHKPKRFVYIGSVDALNNPADGKIIPEPDDFDNECNGTSYAKSKRDASKLVLESLNELDAIICMPSCVLGPGDYKGGFVTTMLKMYLSGIPPFSISGGYDFVDVRDLSEGVVNAALKAKKGSIYIFSGHYISITGMFDILADYLKRKKTITSFPAQLLYFVMPFLSIIYKLKNKRPPLSYAAIFLLTSKAVFSHERASKDLVYKPRDISDTIKDTIDFLKNNGGVI